MQPGPLGSNVGHGSRATEQRQPQLRIQDLEETSDDDGC